MIRHIVLFRLKQDTTQKDIDAIFAELHALKGKLPGATNVVAGKCLHGETRVVLQRYTHGFSIDFNDLESKTNFLKTPDANKLKAMIIEHLEGDPSHDILGFDFQ